MTALRPIPSVHYADDAFCASAAHPRQPVGHMVACGQIPDD